MKILRIPFCRFYIILLYKLSYLISAYFSMPLSDYEVLRIMKQCKTLRNQCQTSFIELQKYLEFMHQTILQKDNFFVCQNKQMNSKLFHKKFFKAYQKLSQLEQAKYYQFMLEIVRDHIKYKTSLKIQQNIGEVKSDIKSKRYGVDIIKNGFFNNSERNHSLQINKKNWILLIKSQNNPYDLQINLQGYLIRQSRKNNKAKANKEFLVQKAGPFSTPSQFRFSLKDVYQFPELITQLWNSTLECHGIQLKKILCNLSDGCSRRGHAEIILQRKKDDHINLMTLQTNRTLHMSDQNSLEEYQYLDIQHPKQKINFENISKLTIKQDQLDGHFVWGIQWQKNQKGALKNVNHQQIAVQRNAVKKIIKSFVSIGNGEAQMPIQMSRSQSNLQQLARACKYFPYFFQKKKTQCYEVQSIVVDGFKKAFCSIIGLLLIRNNMQKPFQPIIGQTYQGFIDGYPIFAEQIDNNKSYISFQTSEIRLYGQLQMKTSMSGVNSIKAGSKGYLTVQLIKLKKTPKIAFTLPMIELNGLIYGERTVQINDTSIMYEEGTNIFCEVNWGKNKKLIKKYAPLNERIDFVKGSIVKLKQGSKFEINKFIDNKNYLLQFKKVNDTSKILGEFYGGWTNQILQQDAQQNRKSLFKVDEQRAPDLYHYKYPLCSDSRMRKDIRLFQMQNLDEAQKQRKKIHQIQKKQEELRLKNIKY